MITKQMRVTKNRQAALFTVPEDLDPEDYERLLVMAGALLVHAQFDVSESEGA